MNCLSEASVLGVEQASTALESCLAEYSGEYVRLVGIDPKAKKRVLETIVQRPNSKVPTR